MTLEYVGDDNTTIMPPLPPTEGVGNILLLVRIPSASALLMSALYLPNQWVDFDQTCTDTLLGGRKNWLDFGYIHLIVKVTAAL